MAADAENLLMANAAAGIAKVRASKGQQLYPLVLLVITY